MYSFCTETPLSSLGPKSSEMDRKTVETCSLVRGVHISAFYFHAKREKDYQSAKTSPCDGMGVHQYPRHG